MGVRVEGGSLSILLKGFRRIGIGDLFEKGKQYNYLEAPLSNGIKGKDAR